MINDASIDIDEEPLGDYENGHIDDAEDVEEEGGDDDLEEVDAGTYEDAASKKDHITRRTANYTEVDRLHGPSVAAPPSGCTIRDYVSLLHHVFAISLFVVFVVGRLASSRVRNMYEQIAVDRYKDMAGSNGKMFTL
jgi:hypothetical protein